MDRPLTLEDLETRWENALTATKVAARRHPDAYRELKSRAADVIARPVDINDYFSTVEKLVACLKRLDSGGQGSIFDIFSTRIAPSSVWHVRMLRMECADLLAHLNAFDRWRREKSRLRMVK